MLREEFKITMMLSGMNHFICYTEVVDIYIPM